MNKINFDLKKAIERTPAFQIKSEEIVREKYQESKEQFLDDFDNHAVTQEISEGPRATNSSNTLNGIGNLFSYIGFYAGDNPVSDLREVLEKNFNLKRKSASKFVVTYPDMELIKKNTPMPWEGGRSWVSGIEKGISGFGYYIYKKFLKGRSEEAVQSENKVRGSSFKRVRYMSEIIKNFTNNLTK